MSINNSLSRLVETLERANDISERTSKQLIEQLSSCQHLLRQVAGDTLLSAEQVAEMLGLSKAAVYKMVDRGHLPSVKLGDNKRIFIRRSELMKGIPMDAS